MNNKFSDYIENDVFKENMDKGTNDYIVNDNMDSTEKLIDKYSKYSKDELMNEFIKLTEEKKRNGTLGADIDRYNSILEPYLTADQKSRMKNIFDKVR